MSDQIFKQRIKHELDSLTPMSDVSGQVIRAGTRARRRRQTAFAIGTAAFTVATLGLGATVVGGLGSEGGGADKSTGGPAGAPGDLPAQSKVDPETRNLQPDPGSGKDSELEEALKGAAKQHARGMPAKRDAFQGLLPARYGEISIAGPNRVWSNQHLVTETGDPQLEFDLNVQGNPGKHDNADWTCGQQEAARPILECAEADLEGGWFAVATFEKAGPADDGGESTYGTSLLVMHPRNVFADVSFNEKGWDGESLGRPAGITPQELVEMAQKPEFMDLLEEQVEVQRQLKPDGMEVAGPIKPVWPS